jgi:selenocysteine lyase/cysteine desulfurase
MLSTKLLSYRVERKVDHVLESAPAAQTYIHLNHASSSLPSQSVFDAQLRFIELESRVGMHRALDHVGDEIARLPDELAGLLGVRGEQIALTESASRSWALALTAVAPRKRLQVFVSAYEWGGNVNNVLNLERASLRVIPGEPDADWSELVAAALEQRDRDAVPVICLPLISCASGAPFMLDGLASIVHDAGGWFFVDASQAVGQIPVSATAIGADVLVFPARKWLRGPRGTAVICFSDRALTLLEHPALIDVYGSALRRSAEHNQLLLSVAEGARRFEIYEHNPAVRLGMLAAVRMARQIGVEEIAAYTRSLSQRLHANIRSIQQINTLNESTTGTLCATVANASIAARVVSALWEKGANVAQVPPIYAPLLLRDEPGRRGLLRFSAHVCNSPSEIDRFAVLLRETLEEASHRNSDFHHAEHPRPAFRK